MNRTSAMLAALVALATTAPGQATPTETTPPDPVAGGLSSRLAPLGASLKQGKGTFTTDLTSTLERSRQETHELIDRIVDSGDLGNFLEAMSSEDAEAGDLATTLKSADKERVRTLLHSRVERKLAEFGRQIQGTLASTDANSLGASYQLAYKDIAREERNLVDTLASEDPEASEDPKTGEPAGPQAPRASWDEPGRRRRGEGRGRGGRGQGRRIQRQRNVIHRQNQQLAHQQHVLRGQQRQQRALAHRQHQRHMDRRFRRQRRVHRQRHVIHNQRHQMAFQNQLIHQQQMQLDMQRRRMRHDRLRERRRRHRRRMRRMQRRQWMHQQQMAWNWNNRMNHFERYVYANGARLSARPFPAGCYYRPDRVERVVRRGLWGAATVAATPFALLASVF